MALFSYIYGSWSLRIICILFCFIMSVNLSANVDETLETKSSAELFGRASSYIETDTLLDRAVAALSIIANRYYAKPEDSAARRDAIAAMYQLGNIYSLRLFDYPKAYTNLSTARMLAEEEGDYYHLSEILLRIANIYNICYDELDQEPTFKVISEALEIGIKGKNEDVITRVTLNLSILRLQKDSWGNHAEEILKIRTYPFQPKSYYRFVCVNIIDAMDAYFNGDYSKAEILFKKVINNLPQDQAFRERYEYGTMHLLQWVYERSGNYEAEEKLLRKRLKSVKNLGLDDYELYTYSNLASFFERRNQLDSVHKYTYLYLLKKDELDQNSGLNRVKNVDMLRQIEKANDEVRELSLNKLKQRRHFIVAVAIIAIVVILLFTFIYLFITLKRNHKLLYQKNRELLDREEQLRLLMTHEDTYSVNEAEEENELNNNVCEADEESAMLFPRILKVMENDNAIYGLGFGIDNLANILHVPQRSVSKAINICGGINFHQFLNGYRIREACRLMQNTDPTSTTVEYIAETVGFKSRTSFASLFKKTIGLTPSEYWKMSHKGL